MLKVVEGAQAGQEGGVLGTMTLDGLAREGAKRMIAPALDEEDGRPSDAQAASWSVFDPRRAWLGTIDVDANLHIFEIGQAYILALRKDAIGVESLVLLEIER